MSSLSYDELTYAVIGAAMEVHNVLGPGYQEKIYQAALQRELQLRGIPFARQYQVIVIYKDEPVGEHFLDLVVDNRLIVELKALDQLDPSHKGQVVSYLTSSRLSLGLLINFGQQRLVTKRVVLGSIDA